MVTILVKDENSDVIESTVRERAEREKYGGNGSRDRGRAERSVCFRSSGEPGKREVVGARHTSSAADCCLLSALSFSFSYSSEGCEISRT